MSIHATMKIPQARIYSDVGTGLWKVSRLIKPKYADGQDIHHLYLGNMFSLGSDPSADIVFWLHGIESRRGPTNRPVGNQGFREFAQ